MVQEWSVRLQVEDMHRTVWNLFDIRLWVPRHVKLVEYDKTQQSISFFKVREGAVFRPNFGYVAVVLWITGALPLWCLYSVLRHVLVESPWQVLNYLMSRLNKAHPAAKYLLGALVLCLWLPFLLLGLLVIECPKTSLGRHCLKALTRIVLLLFAIAMFPLTLCYKIGLYVHDAIRHPELQLFQSDEPWWSRAAFHVSQTFLLDTCHHTRRKEQLSSIGQPSVMEDSFDRP